MMIEHAEPLLAVERRVRFRPEQNPLVRRGGNRYAELRVRAETSGQQQRDEFRVDHRLRFRSGDFALSLRRFGGNVAMLRPVVGTLVSVRRENLRRLVHPLSVWHAACHVKLHIVIELSLDFFVFFVLVRQAADAGHRAFREILRA
ncbi:hypothetical protein SDC9_123727 [bioreactor metagenome]|uniref:Uncharacterized protein n=1 Tax=bioreactor metagenome TaxID=1076179 RepID=A0A645CIK9_9ZZZZ